jgi:hypothetical protein
MAQDCLLLTRPGADLRVENDLAAFAITAGQKDRTSQCAMALAEYRQGHWDKARDWALKLTERGSPYSHSQAYAILAMAEYRQKETESARASLKKCIEIVQTQLPGLDARDLGQDWRDCIISHALYSEAKRMIEGDKSAEVRIQ